MEDLFLLMIAVWYECAFYGRVSARVECGASWHVMISRLSTAFCMYLGYIPMVFWIATPSFHNHIKHLFEWLLSYLPNDDEKYPYYYQYPTTMVNSNWKSLAYYSHIMYWPDCLPLDSFDRCETLRFV